MKTVIYTQINQQLQDEWLALWEKSSFATYVNSPSWFFSVKETFHYKEYVIIAIYEEKQLVALAYAMKEKKYGIPIYTIPPIDYVCGIPFLLKEKDTRVIKALIVQLANLEALFLPNIPEDFVTLLQEQTIDFSAFRSSINYYLTIEKDIKGQVVIRHKKRLLRRSEDIADKLTLRLFTGNERNALIQAFTIDKKSMKQTKGYNTFASEVIQLFYQALATHFGEKFLVALLYDKEKPVAYQIGFLVHSTFFCSQIAFMRGYEQYSLGRLLLIRLIEQLGARGVTQCDFGSGEDHVKRSLTKEKKELYTVILAKNRFKRILLTILCRSQNAGFTFLQRHNLYVLYRRYVALFIK